MPKVLKEGLYHLYQKYVNGTNNDTAQWIHGLVLNRDTVQ